MKNTATWLETKPTGYKMRIQFLPINEAEAKRCSALLLNASIKIVSVTAQGPLSADIEFSDAYKAEDAPKPVVPPVTLEEEKPVVPPVTLEEEKPVVPPVTLEEEKPEEEKPEEEKSEEKEMPETIQ